MARPADAGKRAQSDSPSHLRAALPAPAAARGRRAGPRTVSARLSAHAALETRTDGHLIAHLDGYALDLGAFSAGAADRAQQLHTGLPLAAFTSDGSTIAQEMDRLIRRLARHGLLEYPVRRSRNADAVVIEPQVADYWPQTPPLGNAEVLVLSRFAYMRRRGDAMVLESPRAGALFRICDPKIATALTVLSTPQRVGRLRRQDGFPGIELLALLVDCQILFKVDAAARWQPATRRGRCRPRSLGLSRSAVPRAQHAGPARQPARRTLSICGRHACAAGGAAPLARKEDRFARAFARACGSFAGRKAAA